ncbi:DUF397 domain-containing protein [Streptomyces paromomycinus]|nr:DUF397 domain-containing protein [Streptomyces paromomycinus]
MQLHWRKSSYSADTGSCVEVAGWGATCSCARAVIPR